MNLIDILVQELPKRGGWPVGATSAVQNGFGVVIFIGSGTEKLSVVADDWESSVVEAAQYESALAASKTEWDGEGLPPVECVCEVKVGGDNYNLCRVVYSDSTAGVAFIYLGGDDEKYCGQIDSVGAKAAIEYFRPILSGADKKREQAINKIQSHAHINFTPPISSGQAIALYDAIAARKIPGIKLED